MLDTLFLAYHCVLTTILLSFCSAGMQIQMAVHALTRTVKSPGCLRTSRGPQVVHMHKHMKQASAKDDLLSPVCPWYGQAGCQVWCKEVAFGQSADAATTSQRRFPDLRIVCMTQASTFDVQLSPVCPWCGQAGCQVWCNEVAYRQSADSSTTS